MSSPALRVVRRADAPACASSSAIRRQLERFHTRARPGVLRLAQRHVYLAQLAQSFPALLLALAWPRKGLDPAPVIAGVMAGRPLAELAAQAGVSLWLRRIPSQMLPARLPILPDSASFRSQIGNHLPARLQFVDPWFRTVSEAARWTGEDFALWCARVHADKLPRRWYQLRRRVYLWAWFSAHPDTLAHRLMGDIWNAQMDRRRAIDCAWQWFERVELALNLAGKQVADNWLRPGYADGYEFLPLASAAAIEDEAHAMRHCVRTYGNDVALGLCRLWSMRRDEERIATIEIGLRAGHPMPSIQQLKLASNADAPPPIWQAAWRWLVNQDLSRVPDLIPEMAPPLDRATWQALWRPYWLAQGRVPSWLPLGPSRDVLDML